MDRWLNRVAVVTGASSGIGAACCKDLVSKGLVVVGLARREDRLQELKASLPADQASRFHGRKCDVSQEQEVIDAFAWIDATLGGADVLVNNAGIVRLGVGITHEGNGADLRAILDTNVLGVSWCTREAFKSLKRRNVNDGHILIVNSVAGHRVINNPGITMGMYSPSKYAVTALTEVLRQEFHNNKTQTKITVSAQREISLKLTFRLPPFPINIHCDFTEHQSRCRGHRDHRQGGSRWHSRLSNAPL